LHVPARLTGDLSSPPARRQFLRGRYDGGRVSQVGGPGSHLVAHLARANCLVVVPEDVTALPAGAEVDVVLIEGALQ
jgi:molybdopterin molybdotransferase